MVEDYEFYEEFNALRVFNRGARANFNMSNIKVIHTGDPLNTQINFRKDNASVSESDGSYELEVEIVYPDRYEDVSCDIVIESGDSTLIGNFSTQTISWPAGDDTKYIIPVTITGDDDSDADEIVFAIKNLHGGFFPSSEDKPIFTLTITEGTSAQNLSEVNFIIHPNPAMDYVNIQFDQDFIELVDIEIFNLAGLKTDQQVARNGSILDISGLKEGTYVCRYRAGHEVGQRKLVIIR